MFAGLIQRGVVRITLMTMRFFVPTRREVMAGLGASAVATVVGGATKPGTVSLTLQARPTTLVLRPEQSALAIWELAAANPAGDVRLKRGDRCDVTLRNDLPVAIAPVWRGLDGIAAAESLLGHPMIPPGTTENL